MLFKIEDLSFAGVQVDATRCRLVVPFKANVSQGNTVAFRRLSYIAIDFQEDGTLSGCEFATVPIVVGAYIGNSDEFEEIEFDLPNDLWIDVTNKIRITCDWCRVLSFRCKYLMELYEMEDMTLFSASLDGSEYKSVWIGDVTGGWYAATSYTMGRDLFKQSHIEYYQIN